MPLSWQYNQPLRKWHQAYQSSFANNTDKILPKPNRFFSADFLNSISFGEKYIMF